ncbi:hypothetical protein ACJZ2D_010977 [Fusarium nematophilum]
MSGPKFGKSSQKSTRRDEAFLPIFRPRVKKGTAQPARDSSGGVVVDGGGCKDRRPAQITNQWVEVPEHPAKRNHTVPAPAVATSTLVTFILPSLACSPSTGTTSRRRRPAAITPVIATWVPTKQDNSKTPAAEPVNGPEALALCLSRIPGSAALLLPRPLIIPSRATRSRHRPCALASSPPPPIPHLEIQPSLGRSATNMSSVKPQQGSAVGTSGQSCRSAEPPHVSRARGSAYTHRNVFADIYAAAGSPGDSPGDVNHNRQNAEEASLAELERAMADSQPTLGQTGMPQGNASSFASSLVFGVGSRFNQS